MGRGCVVERFWALEQAPRVPAPKHGHVMRLAHKPASAVLRLEGEVILAADPQEVIPGHDMSCASRWLT